MKVICEFIILYIVMFLIDYFILKKFMTSEYEFMRYKCKLPRKGKKYLESIKLNCSLINAFILSFVCTCALLCELPLFITLPLAFLIMLVLIYIIYSVYGKILKRKKKITKK